MFLISEIFNSSLAEFYCIPISTDEENLKSVVISELDLPTEPSFLQEKETIEDSEKAESFIELYENYNKLFIKNFTSNVNESDEGYLQKRSSINEEDILQGEENSKSIIEKIQTIVDPEVRKEFELDLNNNGQIIESESEKSPDVTDYDPNYASKIVNVTAVENNSVQLENYDLQVDDVGKSLVDGITTIPPISLTDTGIVEVFEQVFFHPTQEENVEVITNDPLNVQVEFDPIQIVHGSRNIDSEVTKVSDDFTEPIIETTESSRLDELVTLNDKAVYDRVTPTGNSGRSINIIDDSNRNDDVVTETPTTIFEEATTLKAVYENVTEIVEVNTKISISIHIEGLSNEESSESDEIKQSSTSEKSSEDSKSVKSGEKNDNISKSSSDSSEENSAKEVLDTYELRILNLDSESPKHLMDDLYKDTLQHDVRKKDQPITFKNNSSNARKIANDDKENYQKFDVKTEPLEAKTFEETTVGIYETFEDIITTIADGIELSKELRASIDSFRVDTDESKTVLDTNNEAISSKNIKSLVNVAEEMTLDNHLENAKSSFIVIPVIIISSAAFLIFICVAIKKTLTRMSLW